MSKIIKSVTRGLPVLVFLAALWAIIAKGDTSSWVIGIPSVLFAYLAWQWLGRHRGPGLNLARLPGFSIWFLWQSLLGGVDVAWRALQMPVALQPGFVRYRMSLPAGQARVFLINVVSLLPGTLSADIDGDDLVLHTLDATTDVMTETRLAEQRVSALFGIDGAAAHG